MKLQQAGFTFAHSARMRIVVSTQFSKVQYHLLQQQPVLVLYGLTIYHPRPPLRKHQRGKKSFLWPRLSGNFMMASRIYFQWSSANNICYAGVPAWLWKLVGNRPPILHTLETFKHFANLCPLVFLQWPTMQYCILIWKLSFLHRLLNSPQFNFPSVTKCFTDLKTRTPHCATMQVPGRGVPLKWGDMPQIH